MQTTDDDFWSFPVMKDVLELYMMAISIPGKIIIRFTWYYRAAQHNVVLGREAGCCQKSPSEAQIVMDSSGFMANLCLPFAARWEHEHINEIADLELLF